MLHVKTLNGHVITSSAPPEYHSHTTAGLRLVKLLHSPANSFADAAESHDDQKPDPVSQAEGRFRALGKYFVLTGPNSAARRAEVGANSGAKLPFYLENDVERTKAEFLELGKLLRDHARLSLQRSYAYRWQCIRHLRETAVAVSVEQSTLMFHVRRGVPLQFHLKHTYLEHVQPIANELQAELGHWRDLHRNVLHNEWLRFDAGGLIGQISQYWQQSRLYIVEAAHLLRMLDSLIRHGFEIFCLISPEKLQTTNPPGILLQNCCAGLNDYNAALKRVRAFSFHFVKLPREYCLGTPTMVSLPGEILLAEILAGLANGDGHVVATSEFLTSFCKAINNQALFRATTEYPEKLIIDYVNSRSTRDFLTNVPSASSFDSNNNESLPKASASVALTTSDYFSGSNSEDPSNSNNNNNNNRASSAKTERPSSGVIINDAGIRDLKAETASFLQSRLSLLSLLLSYAVKYPSLVSESAITKAKLNHLDVSAAQTVAESRQAITKEATNDGSAMKKMVSWLDDKLKSDERKIFTTYINAFWTSFYKCVESNFNYGALASTLHQQNLQSPKIMVSSNEVVLTVCRALYSVCQSLSKTEQNEQNALQCCKCLLASSVDMRLEANAIQSCLTSMTTDKCLPVPLIDNKFCTNTAKVVCDFAKMINHRRCRGSDFRDAMIFANQLAAHWLQTRVWRPISTGNWKQLFLIQFFDLPIIQLAVSGLAETDPEGQNSDVGNSLFPILAEELNQNVSEKIAALAKASFSELMPDTKFWRATYRKTNEKSDWLSNFTENTTSPIFSVFNSVSLYESKLPRIQNFAFLIYKVWIEHIFEQRLRFSLGGATELQENFANLAATIELSSGLNADEIAEFHRISWLSDYLKRATDLLTEPDGANFDRFSTSVHFNARQNQVHPAVQISDEEAMAVCQGLPPLSHWYQLIAHKSPVGCCFGLI